MGFIILVIGYYVVTIVGGLIVLQYFIWPLIKKLFGVKELKKCGDAESAGDRFDKASNNKRKIMAGLITGIIGLVYFNAVIEYTEPEKIDYEFLFEDERTIAVFKPHDDGKQYRDVEAVSEELIETVWDELTIELKNSDDFVITEKSLTEGFENIYWDHSLYVEPVKSALNVNYVLEPVIRTTDGSRGKKYLLSLSLREINYHPEREIWVSYYYLDESEAKQILEKAHQSIRMVFGLEPLDMTNIDDTEYMSIELIKVLEDRNHDNGK